MEVIVTEAANGRYKAVCGDIEINARTPLFSMARKLMAAGVDPDTMLTMRRPGGKTWDLRCPLGAAAKLTVIEPDKGRMHFARHVPFPGTRGGVISAKGEV
jgi:hypothetical protein